MSASRFFPSQIRDGAKSLANKIPGHGSCVQAALMQKK